MLFGARAEPLDFSVPPSFGCDPEGIVSLP